jgi:hypothetical protein
LHAKKVKHHFKKKNLFHELIFFQNDLRFGIFRLELAEQTANKTFDRCEDKWLPFFQLTKLNIVEGKQHLENGYLN